MLCPGLALGDVPTRQPIGIVLTVLGVVVLDFSADATEGPIRAYLLDVVDSEEQDMALNIHAFSAGNARAWGGPASASARALGGGWASAAPCAAPAGREVGMGTECQARPAQGNMLPGQMGRPHADLCPRQAVPHAVGAHPVEGPGPVAGLNLGVVCI